MIANTIRMVDYDQVREYTIGDESSLKENLAVGIINPEDFNKLNLTSELNLKLMSNFGAVIIRPIQDKDVPPGMILLPTSIWANQITGIENDELVFKNIKVKVEATKEAIIGFKDLIKKITEK
jgi:formylmethanofuran dehydrogenase subunit D